MKKFTVVYLFILAFYSFALANPSNGQKAIVDDSLYHRVDLIDSLTFNWYLAHPYLSIDGDLNGNQRDTFNIDYPDSVYIERISQIPSLIPLSYNKIVKNFINVYTEQRRTEVEEMLGLAEYYFPIFEQVLEEYGLPNELKYLPVIESALNPNAVSKASATGLWQFMYYTAKIYKLNMNTLVDERRDPMKSTHAAAKFLKDLYNIYNDWILVIAAYNCGPGNVNKAIRRAGSKYDYWKIYYFLPRETRGYVPAFVAATYVFNYPQYHNLYPKKLETTVLTDTLIVREKLHLKQVAEVLGLPVEELSMMNPQYRNLIIPDDNKDGYVLKIPLEFVSDFIELRDSIFSYKDSVYFNPANMTAKPTYYSKYSPVPPDGYSKLYYTVRPGDNLGYIAEWYNVRTSNIRYWNNIRGSTIRSGQKLAIFVPENKVSKYKNINTMSFADKQKSIGKNVQSAENNENNDSDNYEYVYYKVKSGDTLWKIAKNYPGVSDYDIMKWNNISNAGKINPGQTLKIRKITN